MGTGSIPIFATDMKVPLRLFSGLSASLALRRYWVWSQQFLLVRAIIQNVPASIASVVTGVTTDVIVIWFHWYSRWFVVRCVGGIIGLEISQLCRFVQFVSLKEQHDNWWMSSWNLMLGVTRNLLERLQYSSGSESSDDQHTQEYFRDVMLLTNLSL